MNSKEFIMTRGDDSQTQIVLCMPTPKKYILSRTIPVQKKQVDSQFIDQKSRKKHQTPQYFTNILKDQKKKMFINTFIKKLKNTIILGEPPQQKYQQLQDKQPEQQQIELRLPKMVQMGLLLLWAIQAFTLIIENSLALVFQEIQNSLFFKDFMAISFFFHTLEMTSKFFVHLNYEQNKLIKIKDIAVKYLQYDFWIDLLVFFSLAMHLMLNPNSDIYIFFRVLIFFKIKSLMYIVEHLQVTLIENVYRQQIWSLIKVFISNFTFAHILALALLLMTRFNSQHNWLIIKGFDQTEWSQQYIWAYYWAVTIMLTVGFGDITPCNKQEALCIIFIETFSCILLAYNINCVGTIISKIRSYEVEKNRDLKTFNHINQKSQFDNQTRTRIMNFIKESTQMRRNYNIGQQKEFIKHLPESFRSDILRQMNRHIWNGMKFFQNLSQETLVKLSITIQKKLAHPDQIVYQKGNYIDIIVFNEGGFGYSYNHGVSTQNGRVMQHFKVQSNDYQIASLDFLFQNKLNFDIKCTDYCVFYKISTDDFLSVLKNNSYDSEYFFMIKDKDKFILNEFQIATCHICPKQNHSVFKCPRIHYFPLKQHIINKHKQKYYPRIYQYDPRRRYSMKYRSLRELPINKKKVKNWRQVNTNISNANIGTRVEFQENNDQSNLGGEKFQLDWYKDDNQTQNMGGIAVMKTSKIYQQAMNQIKSKLDDMVMKPKFQWDLEADIAFNFKFYFRKSNSDQINVHMARKSKAPPIKKRKVIKYGYQGRPRSFAQL